jgi:hypothetical protein
MALNTINTPHMAMGLVFMASMLVGWNEGLVLPICSIRIRDQQQIGAGVGVAGSARSAISTIAQTVYAVVLTKRLLTTIPATVAPALLNAGLSMFSMQAYMVAASRGATPAMLEAIPGVNVKGIAAGTLAYRTAYMDAYRTIFFASLAFGGFAIIVSALVPNVPMTSNAIAAIVQRRKRPAETNTNRTDLEN